MKKFLSTLVFTLIAFLSYSQRVYNTEQKAAMDILHDKMKAFKESKNDTTYIKGNSVKGFYYVRFERGDQEPDIDKEIFAAKVGDVVGPYPGDSFVYIFKVIEFENLDAVNVDKIFLYWKGNKADTSAYNKYVNKYRDAIRTNKDIAKMAVKDEKMISQRKKELGYIFEGQTDVMHYEDAFKLTINEPKFIKTQDGGYFLVLKEEKKKVPYKVKLLPVVKSVY